MSTGRRNFRVPRKGSDAANDAATDEAGTEYLETLLGYNARRAALYVIGQSAQEMAQYDLRPVDFLARCQSVLALVTG